jgi:hypothetical protein
MFLSERLKHSSRLCVSQPVVLAAFISEGENSHSPWRLSPKCLVPEKQYFSPRVPIGLCRGPQYRGAASRPNETQDGPHAKEHFRNTQGVQNNEHCYENDH